MTSTSRKKRACTSRTAGNRGGLSVKWKIGHAKNLKDVSKNGAGVPFVRGIHVLTATLQGSILWAPFLGSASVGLPCCVAFEIAWF